jgi:Coenzyme PQQ synthesis protein D (PqqD)
MPGQFSSRVSSRVTTAPDVMLRIIGDEAVILNLKSELYLGLNPVGTRMWTVLQDAPSIQAAYASLLDEFEVEPARLRQDMDQLLDQMLEHGLIELRPGDAAAT